MATTPSHDDEGELLVKPSRLRFGVVVPERTEKLEIEEEEIIEEARGLARKSALSPACLFAGLRHDSAHR